MDDIEHEEAIDEPVSDDEINIVKPADKASKESKSEKSKQWLMQLDSEKYVR